MDLPGIKRWLERASPLYFSSYCILAAFGTYFCMYAFRKPFTAATFEGTVLGGLGLKTLYITAQVFGYTVSKFIGIRVVSGMQRAKRAVSIVALIAVAEVALVLFALTPAPWNAGWLFVNGLPLGMVFGLVLASLEGRRQTEALSAGLCASFILSSGVVKSVGQSLVLEHGVTELWMPAATGALFLVPLLLFVALLAQIPPPTGEDVASRAERAVMRTPDRRRFFRRHALGLVGLVTVYLLLTVGRSLRDDFAVEIWRDLGTSGKPEVFARTEMLVMLGVLLASGMMVRVRSNRGAFFGSLWLSARGLALLLATVFGQRAGLLGPLAFMTLTGLGLYIPYVTFHTTIFERLIATFRERANIGYLMYLADAFGYLGYVGVMLTRNALFDAPDLLPLYVKILVVVATASTLGLFLVARHFGRRMPAEPLPHPYPRQDGQRA